MPDALTHWHETFADHETEAPLWSRRPLENDADLDITPMIDVTFLLLVFFLVASLPDVQTSLQLPAARHGVGVSSRTAVIISLARGDGNSATVYLADGKIGPPLPDDPSRQLAAVRSAVEAGLPVGKSQVLIKAERGVKHRDVARIAQVASTVEGVRLNLAVMELEE